MLFVASSLYSTATFLTSWRDNPAQPYLQNARASLAAAHAASDAPLLDQEVDPLVLQRVAAPENLASHMFALLRDRPEFAPATTQLRMLDSSGRLVEARVTWVRTIAPGPMPQCGYFVQPDKPARLVLDGPLLPADWTVELNYLANSDGSMTLSMTEGPRSRFRCIRDSTGSSPGCRAPGTRSLCGPTPPRWRCASRVRCRSAASSPSRTGRRAWSSTALCCPPTGPSN